MDGRSEPGPAAVRSRRALRRSDPPPSRALTIGGAPIGPDGYTICYYRALESCGVEVLEGRLSGRWLLTNRRRIDYLHLHWPSFFYGSPSRVVSSIKFARFVSRLALSRLCGIRLLWTAHNLYPHDRNVVAGLDRLGRKIVVAMSHRIFVHGRSGASAVSREFPGARGKLVVLPHGNWIGYYPDECTREAARERLEMPPDQFVFLFVGLCKEYKNLEGLVRCFQDEPFPRAALWIVGRFQRPAYRARVSELVERRPDRIHLEDRFVPDRELQYYLAACDVVVLPYSEVLTSGAAMLAIGFGRPVVAPQLGYLQDVVNASCGILYDPSDTDGLRRAMEDVQGRRFDAEAIRQHARSFEWQNAARETISALA